MFANWLRVILLILTFASFLPQLRLIWVRRDASGISLRYVLFNLITASEQFGINFAYAYLYRPACREELFVHNPMTGGDWINLAQTTLFMLLFVVYFSLCLWFPSENELQYKRYALGVYVAYFLIAILPLFVSAIIQLFNNGDPSGSRFVIPYAPHDINLNYAGTILAFLATYYQVERLPLSSSSYSLAPGSSSSLSTASHCSSLSILGLAIQAPLFLVLAISWVFRVPYSLSPNVSWGSMYNLELWYAWVGAVAVNNAAFAIGQGFLFCVLLHRQWYAGTPVAKERNRES